MQALTDKYLNTNMPLSKYRKYIMQIHHKIRNASSKALYLDAIIMKYQNSKFKSIIMFNMFSKMILLRFICAALKSVYTVK